ncbi:NAD(P)/FAD-dependent oxidoreductase [Segetibacter sp. 3557_3]|uniref:NAD(P)/FAD-dependent oxidoreductase n=1 Tax=Segetibacter sp. 3557_3 TaxID=2547429 RepID=UPI0010584135|nr:NAD(P)/FAD-dependent oxidoreductase [Segetibacter sp. 3557_3]TDH26422.1 NAD(P)/FAD-dependent oxidoreductase [Segetibacter sp. 3557_3]
MANNLQPGSCPRIVVVGGGFGGLELAKHLRSKKVEVILVDRHNYHTFQPLLYQVATGALEAETIAFPIRRIFQHHRNLNFRLADVRKINPEKNTIDTSIGEIAYDYLVLATGASTNFFGDKLLEHFTMGMKTIPEALNLRSMILQSLECAVTEKDPVEKEELMTFVIVGGGPTGAELAGALAELKNHTLRKDYPSLDPNDMRVFIVESKPGVLKVMSEEASRKAQEYLEELGVVIYSGVRVKSFDGENLVINNGMTIKTRNVLWAAGVAGDYPEGISPDVVVGGNRLQTDEINRVKGYDNIFAIGDVASVVSPETPDGHPGVAQVAIQQGKHLAGNLLALIENRPTKPFRYNDKGSMATIGRNKAVADIGRFKTQGFRAWVLWCFVHLFSLIGGRNKLAVFTGWITRYFTYNSSSRIIIRPFSRELMREDTAAK